MKSFKPESLMMSYGYNPELSEGALKCPVFQTSTFVFKNAAEGKAFFEIAYGLREKDPSESLGLIYSRLNNPDLEILENRLTLWDKADDCAVFESGMSAISTVMLEFMKPGALLLYSTPTYGGTDHFISKILDKFGIEAVSFDARDSEQDIIDKIVATGKAENLAMVYVETPANPTLSLFDIEMCRRIADHFATEGEHIPVAVDNTLMGPLWSHPLQLGADLVLYSATKYIGGHSDVIAGAVLGSNEMIARIKGMRTFLGNMAGPWTGWLLMRSLETLKPRMELQASNAQQVARFLKNHPKVEKVYYLGLLDDDDPNYGLYKRQYSSPGAMVAFDIKGGEKEAFQFLDNLTLVTLAVSLGSTESLAEHPCSMTHADVDDDVKAAHNISSKLVRISVGVEDADDLIWDIDNALTKVG